VASPLLPCAQEGLLAINASSGVVLGSSTCAGCIGVTWDAFTSTVFAGSSDKDHVYQVHTPKIELVVC
jgi:hypothetical protein